MDNFDLKLNTPTGVEQTHAMASILTKDGSLGQAVPIQRIPRLSLLKSREKIDYEIDMQRYTGPKTPAHPSFTSKITEAEKDNAATLRNMASIRDMDFMKEVILTNDTPEYNGWNTRFCREILRLAPSPKTAVSFLPLIDRSPTEPDTVKTALKQSQVLAAQANQEYSVVTCDQAIYRIAQQVKWGSNSEDDNFNNVPNRMGGLHIVMSFLGTFGVNMKTTGLEPTLSSVFGGVKKMLLGKKFPNNLRASPASQDTLKVQTRVGLCVVDLLGNST